MTNLLKIEVDNEMSTGYVTFSRGEVSQTLALGDDLNIDLDRTGKVIGLELLDLEVQLPEDRLVREFKLDSAVVKRLNEGYFR